MRNKRNHKMYGTNLNDNQSLIQNDKSQWLQLGL